MFYLANEAYFLNLGGPSLITASAVSVYPSIGTFIFRLASCDVLIYKESKLYLSMMLIHQQFGTSIQTHINMNTMCDYYTDKECAYAANQKTRIFESHGHSQDTCA